MSAEGMQVTVVAHGLIEALKKDGVNLDDRLGKNASNYVREIVSHMSQTKPVAQGEVMRLAVALDFADNPRPYHSMQAPADTNGELYRALQTVAKAYRDAKPTIAAGEAVAWIEHHKGGDNLNWDRVDHPYAQATPLYAIPDGHRIVPVDSDKESSDGPCKEADGCPTEMAVLKRFWREHQPKERIVGMSEAMDILSRRQRPIDYDICGQPIYPKAAPTGGG